MSADSTPIRVAQVGYYGPEVADGVATAVAGLARWLPRYGVHIEVWNFTSDATRVRGYDVDGLRIWDLPTHRRPWNFVRTLTRGAWTFVRRRQHAVDLVHFHSVFVPWNVGAAAELRVPYILTPHGGYSHRVLHGRNRWFKAAWWRLREAAYARRAAVLHAVSTGERDTLRRLFPDVPTVVVPNGMDPSVLSSSAKRGSVRQGLKDLLFVGNLDPDQKGLDTLLWGYARFLAQNGDRETRLLLVGPEFQGSKAPLEQLAHTLGIGDRVALTGPAFGEDKRKLLESAYAFVHPSRWEGMPFAVLEALAAGCPVLLTPETNLGEAVQEYGTGVVVARTPESIASGIQSLICASDEHYTSMARRGRQLVEDHFTWPRAAERMAAAYPQVTRAQG